MVEDAWFGEIDSFSSHYLLLMVLVLKVESSEKDEKI